MLCPIISGSGLDATTPLKSGTVISLVAQGIWGQEGKSATKKVSYIGRPTHSYQSSLRSTDIRTHSISHTGAAAENKKDRSLPSRVHSLVVERGKKADMAKQCTRSHGNPEQGA